MNDKYPSYQNAYPEIASAKPTPPREKAPESILPRAEDVRDRQRQASRVADVACAERVATVLDNVRDDERSVYVEHVTRNVIAVLRDKGFAVTLAGDPPATNGANVVISWIPS